MDVGVLARGQHVAYQAGPRALAECWWFNLFEKFRSNSDLDGGNSNMFYFQPYLGKIPILTHIFPMGWNHPPVIHM